MITNFNYRGIGWSCNAGSCICREYVKVVKTVVNGPVKRNDVPHTWEN